MPKHIPTYSYEYSLGEWTEPMTTDVLVEQFDFGDLTEKELAKLLKPLVVERECVVVATSGGFGWNMKIRRIS